MNKDSKLLSVFMVIFAVVFLIAYLFLNEDDNHGPEILNEESGSPIEIPNTPYPPLELLKPRAIKES